jgi:hypothetical protein
VGLWRKNPDRSNIGITAGRADIPPDIPPFQREDDRADIRGVWRGRAERTRGELEATLDENRRLREDNRLLCEQIVHLATHPPAPPAPPAPPPAPPPPPVPPPVDVLAILEQFRKTIQPDIHIRPDASDEQRAGINWQHQGLDNTGDTPANIQDPLFASPPSIPDYVLDIESLTSEQVKGSRGGWYNPQNGS